MPALFTLPQVVPLSSLGAILPGSKLYFFQTGTSTPQAVYQDIDLATPHSQPVVADGSGVFDPIYLDPGATDYRARLTDSSDVQLWQIDDIPSNQQVVQTLNVVAADPEIVLENTSAVAGNKKARIQVGADYVALQLLNDAESLAADVLRAERNQNTITALRLQGQIPYLGEVVYKTADTVRVSTTTLADDPHLQCTLLANSAYIIEGVLRFSGGGAGAHGIKIAQAFSGTISSFLSEAEISAFVNGSGSVSRSPMSTATPLAYATISFATLDFVRFSIVVVTVTSGLFSIQWAQNSSSADNTLMDEFSWIRAHRLP